MRFEKWKNSKVFFSVNWFIDMEWGCAPNNERKIDRSNFWKEKKQMFAPKKRSFDRLKYEKEEKKTRSHENKLWLLYLDSA